jgi:hypothetical protein
MSCKNCIHWRKDKDPETKEGQCLAHPPTPLLMTRMNSLTKGFETFMQSFFPRTSEFVECGEEKPRLKI